MRNVCAGEWLMNMGENEVRKGSDWEKVHRPKRESPQ
jgi:hypothetical protein